VRRPSLDAVRGFDRTVYVVAAGQLMNVATTVTTRRFSQSATFR